MGRVLNKTTKEYHRSVNTPDYPDEDWWVNPTGAETLHAAGVPSRYWNVDGSDNCTEMSAGEKTTVDDAVLRHWRYHCDDDGLEFCGVFDATGPTVCPDNGAHTISDIQEYEPHSNGVDEAGDMRCNFNKSDGTRVAAKHV